MSTDGSYQIILLASDFLKINTSFTHKKLTAGKRQHTKPKCLLSASEVMTIVIALPQSGYKNFKHFYLFYVFKYLHGQFPALVSYSRFVILMQENVQLLAAYLSSRLKNSTGISFIDSTSIQVCKPKRMSRNKVFSRIAKKAKSTIGWFFGFKLHLIVTEQGDLVAVKLTKANIDDRVPVLDLAQNIFGKLFGDKGYISKKLTDNFRLLYQLRDLSPMILRG